jgi:uncharacterized protein YcfJ
MPNEQQLDTVVQSLPTVATLALIGLLVLGLILWLMGRKLARPACIISGLVLGGLAGFAIANRLSDQGSYVLPLTLGAAIAGALLAALLFRVWMGLSCAVLLALVAPAASLVWQGSTPIFDLQPAQVALTEAEASPPSDNGATAPPTAESALAAITQRLRQGYEAAAEVVRNWWDDLAPATRSLVIGASVIGAIIGLLLGLILPNTAAIFESALVGAMLIFFAGRTLLREHLPEQTAWLPATPRAMLVTLGLITILGLLIQWTLFRKAADK